MTRLHGLQRLATVLFCASALIVGCGGNSSGIAASTTPVSEVPRVAQTAPVLPTDLWQLVPPEALAIADLDVARLREWQQLGTLKQWAQRYGCVTAEDLEVMDRIDRVVLAVGHDDFLLLVQGRAVEERDVPAAVQDELRETSVTFSVLVPGTVLFATQRWTDAVVSRMNAPETPSVRSANFVTALSPILDAEGAVLWIVSVPPQPVAQEAAAELTRWGVSKIGQGLLAHAYWGFSARLDADDTGVAVRGAVAGGTAGATTSLIEAVNSSFWQAGLVMRLFGLPPVLSSARFQQSDGSASVDLRATASDLNALAPRLEELIKSRALQCAPVLAESPAPATGLTEVTP